MCPKNKIGRMKKEKKNHKPNNKHIARNDMEIDGPISIVEYDG